MKKAKIWITACVHLLFCSTFFTSSGGVGNIVTDDDKIISLLKQNIPKDYKIAVHHIPKEMGGLCWVNLNVFYLEESLNSLAQKFGNNSTNKDNITIFIEKLRDVRIKINNLELLMQEFECHYREEKWPTEDYFDNSIGHSSVAQQNPSDDGLQHFSSQLQRTTSTTVPAGSDREKPPTLAPPPNVRSCVFVILEDQARQDGGPTRGQRGQQGTVHRHRRAPAPDRGGKTRRKEPAEQHRNCIIFSFFFPKNRWLRYRSGGAGGKKKKTQAFTLASGQRFSFYVDYKDFEVRLASLAHVLSDPKGRRARTNVNENTDVSFNPLADFRRGAEGQSETPRRTRRKDVGTEETDVGRREAASRSGFTGVEDFQSDVCEGIPPSPELRKRPEDQGGRYAPAQDGFAPSGRRKSPSAAGCPPTPSLTSGGNGSRWNATRRRIPRDTKLMGVTQPVVREAKELLLLSSPQRRIDSSILEIRRADTVSQKSRENKDAPERRRGSRPAWRSPPPPGPRPGAPIGCRIPLSTRYQVSELGVGHRWTWARTERPFKKRCLNGSLSVKSDRVNKRYYLPEYVTKLFTDLNRLVGTGTGR
ncbi:kit ligand-like isoform X1 [Arapaima gigas]